MKTGFNEVVLTVDVPLTGDIRTLRSELTYFSEILGYMIVVPEGFKTDLGSIPQVLQGVFPKDGKAMYGYILHDYLYQVGIESRSISDDVLEEAMESLGVSWGTRRSVRLGLAIGGWVAWDAHRSGKGQI